MSSLPLQATTTSSYTAQTVSTQSLYIDASSMQLPYIQIEDGFVSPLQVPGELLAPFNQSRIGYQHEGVDIRAAEGTPIFAIADGVVTKAAPDSKGVDKGGGHMVFVDFGNGIEGRYMHLSSYGVQLGDKVKAGQVLGFTGNTGESTTPHLHFELRIDGNLVDPAFIFEASQMVINEASVTVAENLGQAANTSKIGLFNEPFYVVQQ